jgi:hypothetical protein
MIGRTQGLALVVAGMVALSAPALACVIDLPVCEVSKGRFARLLEGHGGDVAYFDEDGTNGELEAIYLVECTSRQGVKAAIPPSTGFFNEAADKTHEYLSEVMAAKKVYTTSEIKTGLAALGVKAKAIKLPAGHCGCDLPKMPLIGCGDAP